MRCTGGYPQGLSSVQDSSAEERCVLLQAWNGWSQCIDILLSHPSTQTPTDGEASGRNPAFRWTAMRSSDIQRSRSLLNWLPGAGLSLAAAATYDHGCLVKGP